jgi:hypothetical protein
MMSEAKRDGASGTKTLIITGTATLLAKQHLAELGWTLRTGEKLP